MVLIAGAALMVARTAFTQEIGWLDLTDLHPRERIRSPHAVGGECGGSASFDSSPSVDVTLMYLDKTSYSLGEEVTYEVKIQNTGKVPIEIPWTVHLGDLEPADPSEAYTYLHATVSLDFVEADSNRSFSIYANSYGAANIAGTTRKLLPGESAFVRARQKLDSYEEWWQKKINDSSGVNVIVSADLLLNKVIYSPGEKTDDATDHSVCVQLFRAKAGRAFDIMLLPATPLRSATPPD
jgi:uncharacterized repeat protein (TIGR01451 family)